MLNTLYIRLSLVFLLLTAGLTIVVGWQSIQSATRFVDETEQKLNADLAKTLAVDFQPFLTDSIDHQAIQQKIEFFIGINPRIDIYLLGSTGMIKALFVPSGREPIMGALDIAPLNAFLEGEELPIWGQDPLSETGSKPFTVATLEIMGEKGCYLYIVLGSDRYDSSSVIKDSYIIQTLLRHVGWVLLVTVLVGLFLFALLTRRLGRISAMVKNFAMGKYDKRIRLKGHDEIAVLASSVDAMADKLEENISRLEKTDQQRRELVANISHDLRSPLSSIRGYLETILIKANHVDTKEIVRFAEIGLNSTERLSRLVDDLFDLSKFDANQFALNAEPFSLTDLVQDVVQQFEPKASKLGIRISAEFEKETILAHGDIGLVERALTNLIDNAVKFSSNGGEVRVIAKWDGKAVHIDVKDFGKGIPSEELPMIFDRFYRVDKSRNKLEGGSGLGLAITKRIVELHNSTLSVTSQLNSGTTFSFWLPTVSPTG